MTQATDSSNIPAFDSIWTGVNLATMTGPTSDYGILRDAALAVADGRIAWLGPMTALDAAQRDEADTIFDLDGAWITPGLIDCHTHVVFAGNRVGEFEQRQKGATYEEIARRGGGINATVRATRAASERELVDAALPRIRDLLASGVTTVEIKSGYGLELETELRMLRAAHALADIAGFHLAPTYLAAHSVPSEFSDNADAFMERICGEDLPAVAASGLASAVDAYCEEIAFTPNQVERLFATARDFGLRVKLHADQLSDSGGAALAAKYDALSADHLEYSNQSGIDAMAASGTVAVLLPGAFQSLRETRLPPVAALRSGNVPIAIATDCNPGTSPLCSILDAMNLGCVLFGLTPAETLRGVTVNAATALGVDTDRGTLQPGKRADFAVWDIAEPAELSYWSGRRPLSQRVIDGVVIQSIACG